MADEIKVSVISVVGNPLCVAYRDGDKLYDRIVEAFEAGYRVSLSFCNVTLLTSAFLNNAIGRLYGRFSSEEIEACLSYNDIEPDDQLMVAAVVENAKQFFNLQRPRKTPTSSQSRRRGLSLPVQSIDNHTFTAAKRLFLDANIWLYIYSPRETEDKHKLKEVYSAALTRMLAAQSKLFTDVLIISEFMNTYARTKWRTSSVSSHEVFKNYRKSKQFKPVAKQIASAAKKSSVCVRYWRAAFHNCNITVC